MSVTRGQDPPLSRSGGGCQFVSLAGATPLGSSMDTHKWHIQSNPAAASFHVKCLSQCLSDATGQIPRSNACVERLGGFPGEMTVLCNWTYSQVKCLSHATWRSGRAMEWSWTTHIRSSHMTAQSLGQMSVSCSWAAQPPGTHKHTYQAHNNF